MSWIAQNLWLIPVLPLLAAGISALLKRPSRSLAAGLAIGSMGVSFLLSCAALVATLGKHGAASRQVVNFDWFALGDTVVRLGWVLDPLTAAMVVMITFVGSLIFIFSVGYMAHDENFTRFFCFLSLFAAAMLGLIIANNLLLLFMCWELVGLASYLLIGFWFHKPSAAAAAKKAFITTRIGDVFFFLGIVWLYSETGTLLFYDAGRGCLEQDALAKMVAHTTLGGLAASSAIGLLLFCGAIGKSGQLPLHVWLPDAMEGPTPVSALIHAATMVAAGVYMLCRVFILFTPEALSVIAWIGGGTAILAALMAVQQNDIKRILAYSTLSQLGYMVMAVGLGGPATAMFHLTTHAFFKALLFLGAGSVIYALHHEQDIWKMGGLKSKMSVTFWTFLIATLALCGVPPFSGFFSKDEILALALGHNMPLFVIASIVAVLTTFYMFRLVIVAFINPAKSDPASHAHESPSVMTLPLVFLAVLTIAGGFIGIDKLYEVALGKTELGNHTVAMAAGLGAFAIGLIAAWTLYANATADSLTTRLGAMAHWMRDRFYFDECYEWLNRWTQELLATVADWFDRWIIAGAGVKGLSLAAELGGGLLRLMQTGNVQTYALLIALATALLFWRYIL